MKDNDLLKVQVIISLVIVLLLTILIVGIAVGGSDVKAEIKSEIQEFKDGFEMPDFSSVNELMDKVEPLFELANELNDPVTKYYVREFKYLLARIDEIEGADLVINGLPGWSLYYANESWRHE